MKSYIRNLTEFNKDKTCTWKELNPEAIRAGDWTAEAQPWWEGPVGLGRRKVSMRQQCAVQQGKPAGLHWQEWGQGSAYPSLLHAHQTTPRRVHPVLAPTAPSTSKALITRLSLAVGHWDGRGWSTCWVSRGGRELGSSSLEKRWLQGDLPEAPACSWWGCQGGARLFTVVRGKRMWNETNWSKTGAHWPQGASFISTTVKEWSRLPRGA